MNNEYGQYELPPLATLECFKHLYRVFRHAPLVLLAHEDRLRGWVQRILQKPRHYPPPTDPAFLAPYGEWHGLDDVMTVLRYEVIPTVIDERIHHRADRLTRSVARAHTAR